MRTLDNYNRWLNSPLVSAKDKETLKKMTQEEIDDAFFKDVEFGTAGMRGILGPGTNRMNEFTVRKATVGFAIYLLDKYPNVKKDGIVISHDNRHFSRSFTLQTAKTLTEFGIKTYIFEDLRPTPELSFAVRFLKCSGGIMITASHNPKEYNGYKVYDENGCQLIPEKIDRLIDIISDLPNELNVTYTPDPKPAQIVMLDNSVDDEYVRLVESIQLHPNLDKSKFKIVYTPNHGTGLIPVMRVFKDLGYKVYPVESQCTFDPDFKGTKSPNPEEAVSFEEPIKFAKKLDAQLILMTDPDGDRVGVAYRKKKGEYVILNGNQSGALLLDYVLASKKEQGTLPAHKAAMFNTVVTSTVGQKIASYYGIHTEQFLTGFKYIGDRIAYYEKNKKRLFQFGYEESNGALIAPFARDKDGTQACLMLAEMALKYFLEKKTLGDMWLDIGSRVGYYEDKVFSVKFEGSEGAAEMNRIMHTLHKDRIKKIGDINVTRIEDFEKSIVREVDKEYYLSQPKANLIKIYLENGASIAVRPSGTEPKIKFYTCVVSDDPNSAVDMPQQLYQAIKKDLDIK